MCLLDFIKNSQGLKSKKSLKQMQYKYSTNFMQKYHDINIIHFNENMSMVNKLDNLRFQQSQRQRHFKNSPIISNAFGNRRKTLREWGIESASFDLSSELSTTSDEGVAEFSDEQLSTQGESFCTLCTSSFSFSNCNGCNDSVCSSKCNNNYSDINTDSIEAPLVKSRSVGRWVTYCIQNIGMVQ